MKALTCEMCGSTNLIKEGGVFICQSCGTKYSVEEAKKMMVEGTVDVKGIVSIDTSKEFDNLLILARRAKEADNVTLAIKYFNEIALKDPHNWEAFFYCVFYEAKNCNKGEVLNNSISIIKAYPGTLSLIKDYVTESQQEEAVSMIVNDIFDYSNILVSNATNTYFERCYDLSEDIAFAAISLCDKLGDNIKKCFEDRFINISVRCWKMAMTLYSSYMTIGQNAKLQSLLSQSLEVRGANGEAINNKILAVSPNYNPKVVFNKKSRGCYVATAVYGSYDCPEVWTLRRFRDFTLDETWYGRLFIKLYYATSPTFVKYYGNAKIFKNYGKKLLDKWVAKLNSKGYESTPYDDKY